MSPMLIIVDEVGPPPTEGYLNAAIAAANSAVLDGHDTIEVRRGSYDASQAIEDGVTLVSEDGNCTTSGTHLTGNMTLDTEHILLGRFRDGFTIENDILVSAGVDASTIHINWNDLLGIVTNAGLNTLDATYNYWDGTYPGYVTVGDVDYLPYLPMNTCTIIEFMDEHGLSPDDAIIFAKLLLLYQSENEALVGVALYNTFGFTLQEIVDLMNEYGWMALQQALRGSGGDYERFLVELLGYGVAAGAGGVFADAAGAGGAVGQLQYTVGETMLVYLVLAHPLTGEPVTDALVTTTVALQREDDWAIVYFDVVPFDAESGEYRIEIDTTGWEPGVYDVWVGDDAGSGDHTIVTLVAAE